MKSKLKRESHRLLGIYLLKSLRGLPTQRYEKAFLFGCIQPDINIFTYLKGSMRVRLLKGHNFRNSERCVNRTIEKLQNSGSWKMKDYYRLGKLIHYISDAFTYPHNESYDESIREHRIYEGKLNCHFKNNINIPQYVTIESMGSSVIETVRMIHRQYSDAVKDISTDMAFIVNAAEIVFNSLVSEASASAA